jgi:hypothetical protein
MGAFTMPRMLARDTLKRRANSMSAIDPKQTFGAGPRVRARDPQFTVRLT